MATSNTFSKLAAINCKEHVESKNGFSYLSWPWAVSRLRETVPEATWEVRRFDGLPYLKTECGFFVEVAVTVEGVTLSQIHPVLDHRNQPISAPNAFHINTSIQRCLVKAISLHGLGLYIYAGEDLPEAHDPHAPVSGGAPNITPHGTDWEDCDAQTKEILAGLAVEVGGLLMKDDVAGALARIAEHDLSVEQKVALNTRFDSRQRTKMRKYLDANKSAPA